MERGKGREEFALRTPRCRRGILLLDDTPVEMDTRPGLAPGKSGVAARRLDDFGMRVVKNDPAAGIAPA